MCEVVIKINCGDHTMSSGKAFFKVHVSAAGVPVVLTPGGTETDPFALPDETVNEAITDFDIDASGGNGGPYTFVVEGTLPPGLVLQSNDVDTARISGTPTQEGDFTFDVVATDSAGAPARTSFRSVVRR